MARPFACASLGCDDGSEQADHGLLQEKTVEIGSDACKQNAYTQSVCGASAVWAPTPWGAVPPPPPGHSWEALMRLALGVAQNDATAMVCVEGVQHPRIRHHLKNALPHCEAGQGAWLSNDESGNTRCVHPETARDVPSKCATTATQADMPVSHTTRTTDGAAVELSAEVPVGAVLVAPDGRILAAARNAPIAMHDPTAHAEVLALRRGAAALGNYRLSGCVLVVTLEPCLMCVGAMIHARLAGVVYGAADMKAGAVESCFAGLDVPFANHRVWHYGGVLGEVCARELKAFFAARRL